MARIKSGLDAVQAINTFLFYHPDLINYEIDDIAQNIYFETDSDLFDIESDFEKGLPVTPIITTFLAKSLQKIDSNPMLSYSPKELLIFIDICVPNKDRKKSYSEGLILAEKVSILVSKDLNLALFDSFDFCKAGDIERLGSKKFNEKGFYCPQRLTVKAGI